MKIYRQFKRKHRLLHILIVAIAIVMLWKGIWSLLDAYLFPGNVLAGNLLSILVAFFILYLDDFHLKELE